MLGVQLITDPPLNYRNRMIAGISLAIAFGITNVPAIVESFSPIEICNIITGSPIILGFLISFILNIIVPEDNSKEEAL